MVIDLVWVVVVMWGESGRVDARDRGAVFIIFLVFANQNLVLLFFIYSGVQCDDELHVCQWVRMRKQNVSV